MGGGGDMGGGGYVDVAGREGEVGGQGRER